MLCTVGVRFPLFRPSLRPEGDWNMCMFYVAGIIYVYACFGSRPTGFVLLRYSCIARCTAYSCDTSSVAVCHKSVCWASVQVPGLGPKTVPLGPE